MEKFIYAGSSWDKSENKIVFNNNLYDESSDQWFIRDRYSSSGYRPPTSWELYKIFNREVLTVTVDKLTGLVRIDIEYFSPQLSKKWAELIVKELNAHIREEKLDRLNTNINYLLLIN